MSRGVFNEPFQSELTISHNDQVCIYSLFSDIFSSNAWKGLDDENYREKFEQIRDDE